MFRRRPRSGDVNAVLRFPQGTSYEAAFAEAKPWGEQFPGAHVRLEIGDEAVIDVPFSRRRPGNPRLAWRTPMVTICREFFQGVWLGCRILVPVALTAVAMLAPITDLFKFTLAIAAAALALLLVLR